MKNIYYALIIVLVTGLSSCKKNENISIKQFDDQQIQGYIAQNGLTGMKRDTSGGDTTGIYYQIISAGTGPVIDYPDKISYVYSYHTFDNEFSSTDTIVNHTNNYLGHVTPNALQISLKNIAKRKGTKLRLLIPSRLGFGRDGYFAGSIHINGNECLDYTVNLIDQDYDAVKKINYQSVYDDISIQKYMAANSLTGYTKASSGLYYKIITPGTGTDPITVYSTLGVQYTGYLFNGTVFDSATTTDGTAATSSILLNFIPGWQKGLPLTTAGGVISLLIPSAMAYGDAGSSNSLTGSTIPSFSCLRFDVTVVSVAN